jgi:zinc finger CCCH domain-containing protein 13
MDGIQAWKKGMKEKEEKEKEKEKGIVESTETTGGKPAAQTPVDAQINHTSATEGQLDEIQLFKMMMKRDQVKSKPSELGSSPTEPSFSGMCMYIFFNSRRVYLKI